MPDSTEENIHHFLVTIIQFKFSVRSNKKGYLENLTDKDFEVYERKEIQEIDFLSFDESKNQYIVAFYEKEPPADSKPHKLKKLKVKVKMSKEGRKDYGKFPSGCRNSI
ncbi:MAG TPA: hypothetical protein VF604_16655 [Pyrinomonadaceae bacterium]